MDKIGLTLSQAPDDAQVNDPKFQEELRAFSKSLHTAGVSFTQRGMAFDSIDVAGYPLPEFLVVLGPPSIAALATVAGIWVKAHVGRKVRLKFGDIMAEARTPEEIGELLKRAAEFKDRKRNDSSDRP